MRKYRCSMDGCDGWVEFADAGEAQRYQRTTKRGGNPVPVDEEPPILDPEPDPNTCGMCGSQLKKKRD
jgi:hypothetical protein